VQCFGGWSNFAIREWWQGTATCMRTVNWPGISGKIYTFEVYPSNLSFKPVPGIYLLCGETPEGEPEAFYVGETHSFYDTINGNEVHEGFPHVALFPCGDPRERHRILNDLRQALVEKGTWQ
jgi:hypothetical protein